MRLISSPSADDLESVRRWFKQLSDCVQAVDFERAYPLFADDLVAFGTFSDFVTERPTVVKEQWSNVWPTIRNFRWRLDGVRAIVSPDRLSAIGMTVWFASQASRRYRSNLVSRPTFTNGIRRWLTMV